MMRVGLLALLLLAPAAQAQDNLVDWARQHGVQPSTVPVPQVVPTGNAALTVYATRGEFDAAVPSQTCEGFEAANIAPGGVTGIDAPLNSSTNTAQFPAGSIVAGIEFSDNPGPDSQGLALLGAGFDGNPSKVVVANTFVDSFDITFAGGPTAIGMDLQSHFNPDTTTVSFFDAGNGLIGSVSAASSPAGSFLGVSSTTPIARVNIDSPTDQAEGADDICFGVAGGGALPPVPQPNVIPATDYTGLGIMALLVGLLGVLVWRSRN